MVNKRTVDVDLGERSYTIQIGAGLLGQNLAELLSEIQMNAVVVVTNPTVWQLYGETVAKALAPVEPDVFQMPDGEQYKSLDTYSQAMDYLLQKRHNRDTLILAVGGGVVGDLAGFVAATYQRGVDFVQVPTTLLAQVDSSVGGKTAVNHPAGKNMIGAFYQPKAVVIDTDVLMSLPDREYAAGLAEVVKYGVIDDAELFAYLEAHIDALNARDVEVLGYVIQRACEIKASVVERDEREGGLRAILNFGHTFGHAIENLSGYGVWLHGEAVAIGMMMAARFSEKLNLLSQGQSGRLKDLLGSLHLPVTLQNAQHELPRTLFSADQFIDAMGMDKKAQGGQIRFIVARSMGEVELISDYSWQALSDTLTEYLEG